MVSDSDSVQVCFTPEFKRNLRALAKKYPHIRTDVQPVIEQIEAGQFIGDQVKGIGHPIFKVRVRNTDTHRGKRAGYRIIYYLKTQVSVILVTIYSKSEQSDISPAQIRRIVERP